MGLALKSLIEADGRLTVFLQDIATPEPGPGEVVVRMEASPIHPADVGQMFGLADPSTLQGDAAAELPSLTGMVSEEVVKAQPARVGVALTMGGEGAGVVTKCGPGAEGFLGKTVAIFGGGMYAQCRTISAAEVMVLPDGTDPRAGAAAFINPLTALGMLETMRAEGHKALVHTAASSSIGHMLIRLCQEDGVDLVNIVRRPEQAQALRALGARYVVDSSATDYEAALTEAVAETGATLAFDAVGGSRSATQILAAMEAALQRTAPTGAFYGSPVHKQVYIYGGLDPSPLIIERTAGVAWGVGGWLFPWALQKVGPGGVARMRARVAAGLTTTFAIDYAGEISLAEMLKPEILSSYTRRASGQKYLVRQQKP